MIFTVPTLLTLTRLALLPFIAACFYLQGTFYDLATWVCFGLYVIAAITDFLDGWIARKFNQISSFGTFLDPISDKIFVAAILILLVGFHHLAGLWMLLPIIILGREFLIAGLREYLGPHNVQMPVTQLAKWKTTAQMLALGLLILVPVSPFALIGGQALLLIATILTVITGWGYLKAGLAFMKEMP